MSSMGCSLILICFGLVPMLAMSRGRDSSDEYFRNWLDFKQFQEYQTWKRETKEISAYPFEIGARTKKSNNRDEGPPPVDQFNLMARYIVNQAGK